MNQKESPQETNQFQQIGMAEPTFPLKGASESSTEIFEVVIIVILVIVLVVLATMAVDFSRKRRDCYTYSSPWCYRDWMCPNQPTGQQNVWTNLINANLLGDQQTNKCFPIASNGITPTFAGSTFNPPQMCDNVWPTIVGPNVKKSSNFASGM